jgi:formamidopyrimidine-DNA glycosylase
LPELPEVEVVRRGLERHVAGRTVASAEVFHPRAVRRHLAGPEDFAASMRGVKVVAARRRGKYLWLPVSPDPAVAPAAPASPVPPSPPEAAGVPDASLPPTPGLAGPGATAPLTPAGETPGGSVAEDALLAHLGMSGQLLLGEPDRPLSPHVRVRFTFTDAGPDLRFTDQRTFGHLVFEPGGATLPPLIAHIAADPLEAAYDEQALIARLRARHTGIKTALLDQSLVSGVGNIYADEALWRAKIHWARPAASLSRAGLARLLAAVREVLTEALVAGGTSFDSLYVNVNGESGYFGRSLAVYGREGEPCPRCGAPIRRDPFANRSAYSCPVCQRRPRSRAGARDLRRRST